MKTVKTAKTINGVKYASQREFVAALVKSDVNDSDKYRIAGREYLGFRTIKEAREFYRAA